MLAFPYSDKGFRPSLGLMKLLDVSSCFLSRKVVKHLPIHAWIAWIVFTIAMYRSELWLFSWLCLPDIALIMVKNDVRVSLWFHQDSFTAEKDWLSASVRWEIEVRVRHRWDESLVLHWRLIRAFLLKFVFKFDFSVVTIADDHHVFGAHWRVLKRHAIVQSEQRRLEHLTLTHRASWLFDLSCVPWINLWHLFEKLCVVTSVLWSAVVRFKSWCGVLLINDWLCH